MTASTATPSPAIAESQKIATAFLGTALSSGVDPLLKAQADLLVSVESTVTDWLHRRHEAVADTKRLVGRLSGSTDPAAFLKAQQEWASGVFNRLAADAAACQSATLQLVDRAQGWVQQGADAAAGVAPQAAEAARAATAPLRPTARVG